MSVIKYICIVWVYFGNNLVPQTVMAVQILATALEAKITNVGKCAR